MSSLGNSVRRSTIGLGPRSQTYGQLLPKNNRKTTRGRCRQYIKDINGKIVKSIIHID